MTIMKWPEYGEKFTAKIDRISGSGNEIIETSKASINIGPVVKGSEGKEIEALKVSGNYAKCLTDSVKSPNYTSEFLRLTRNTSPKVLPDFSSGYSGGIQTDADIEFCDNCGTLLYNEGGTWKCENCDQTESDTDSAPSEEDLSRQGSPDELERLRKEAEEAAVEQITEGSVTKRHPTPEYTRSSTIRQYVKARANGYCEGCGDQAPFTSKTGEPYLHAHHIHELSDGGSDTPDTVIALCPNCHYHVHHGEGGEEYNQELLEVVQGLEQ
ncbi:HNH endonuclease [Halosolutus halophilus]|uniref:HNH endonuclease n=1 Tax=Halosolutus halophilus TaxID=1552990 RepID=UPI00223503F2|nr:HNH endonuclease [Halosolutus halophilus]